MVVSQISLLLLLSVAWSVLAGVNSYGVLPATAPKGFHQPDTSVLDPSVTKTKPILHKAVSPSSTKKGGKKEASDYEIMSAIEYSMAQWREMKERRKSRIHRRAVEIVCHERLGCFHNSGLFEHLDILPQAPHIIGTRFVLYTRDLPEEGELVCFQNATTLHKSKFNPNHPVKIIIHGFGSSGGCDWVIKMTKDLLSAGDFNVIVVDWENGAGLPYYLQAAANVRLVGRQLARFLELLHEEKFVNYDDIHVIGFSLGAQVAGYAGMEIKSLGRISGLDPASPLFEGYHVNTRLDPTDAQFVDVIHTNGNYFPSVGLGIYDPMGHADFYPNGGIHQPGCQSVLTGVFKDFFLDGSWEALCSHRRAIDFFIDSIDPTCSFTAFPCDSYENFVGGRCFHCGPGGCPSMGFYADKASANHGKFYLVNRGVEPLCAYQKKIEVTSSKGKGYTRGGLNITLHSSGGRNQSILLAEGSQVISEGEKLQQVVASQPEFEKASKISVLYSKHEGWFGFRSGEDSWYVDKISISDDSGKRYSYCGTKTEFKTGEMKILPLSPEDCTPELI